MHRARCISGVCNFTQSGQTPHSSPSSPLLGLRSVLDLIAEPTLDSIHFTVPNSVCVSGIRIVQITHLPCALPPVESEQDGELRLVDGEK